MKEWLKNNKIVIIMLFLSIILITLITLLYFEKIDKINSYKKDTKIGNNSDIKLASLKESYIGYYADVDSDGIVDGVIYADLAHSKSGEWGKYNHDIAIYSYSINNKLKEYIISENTYNEAFGEEKIVTLKKGSIGNDRFYVMALEDFKTSDYNTFSWYKNAVSKMNPPVTSNDFGKGKENTKNMIEKWNAAGTSEGYINSEQYDEDIWNHIQKKYYEEGWFLPSIGELVAFADYLENREGNPVSSFNDMYSFNYGNVYNVSSSYWSSSQINDHDIWFLCFDYFYGFIRNNLSHYSLYVRLTTTF